MIDPDHGKRRRNEMTRCSLGPSWDKQVKAHERLMRRWEKIQMDKDHARRVLEHQEKQQTRMLYPLQNHGDAVLLIHKLNDRIDDLQSMLKEMVGVYFMLKEMVGVYWGEGDGIEPPPEIIQRALKAIETMEGDDEC